MKSHILLLSLICCSAIVSCSPPNPNTIELPLTTVDGYGHIVPNGIVLSPYRSEEENPRAKTHLSVKGAPETWTHTQYGDIEMDIYQHVYQNYLAGNITEERFAELKEKWEWKPDTLQLSKEPIKTKVAFAYGRDVDGFTSLIVDRNNNLDFSDDESFTPPTAKVVKSKRDAAAKEHAITITYERFINNQIQTVTTPLLIYISSKYNLFFGNFPQHKQANFRGEKIAVTSERFTTVNYETVDITLVHDTLKSRDRITGEKMVAENEFIEISGEIYKNKGVNTENNTLILEKIQGDKHEIASAQVGFTSFGFEGNDFVTGAKVSSQNLKGKYVLLDFWAVWCMPCIQELPNLKKLYKKADKDKFEIVGIVADSPEDGLRNMIEKDLISWPQIRSNDTNNIIQTFGVQGYPTTFLLDPNGVIIAKNIRGKALEQKVLELTSDKDDDKSR